MSKPKKMVANIELVSKRFDELTRAETELASLRLLCKRILATHDYSAYAKGSVQELWREFKREVEK